MEDSIIYIRTPYYFERDFVFGSDFADDARAALELNEEQVDAIAGALHEFGGFLDRETLEALVLPHVEDAERVRRLTRFISYLDRLSARSGMPTDAFVERVQRRLREQYPEAFAGEEPGRLAERIASFVADQPGFRRQRKAERLYEEVGIPVRDIKIICDLRPVFDQAHENVEGMVLVTTFKLVATDIDGLPITLQAKLTESQVADLAEKSGDARRKVAALRRLMDEKNLPVPSADE